MEDPSVEDMTVTAGGENTDLEDPGGGSGHGKRNGDVEGDIGVEDMMVISGGSGPGRCNFDPGGESKHGGCGVNHVGEASGH